MKCDHCGKKGYTAHKCGKPFCFSLKNKLKESNISTGSNINYNITYFKDKYHICKHLHMKDDCLKNNDIRM